MFNVSARSLLKVALQILGVILLIKGLGIAIVNLGSLWPSQNPSPFPVPVNLLVITISMAIIPPLVGLFLVLKADQVANPLYPSSEEEVSSIEALFTLAMKITGMVLVVTALPDLIQIITNLVYMLHVTSAHPAMGFSQQMDLLITKSAANILYLALGCYLMTNGRIFLQMACKADKTSSR